MGAEALGRTDCDPLDQRAIDVPEASGHPDFPGMEAPRSEAWGLVGTTGGDDGPILILNGYIDVVPPGDPAHWKSGAFQPTVVGDVVRGRGACDMKAGVVAAIVVAKALHDSGLRLTGKLTLQSVVGEEDGGVHTAGAGALTFRIEVTGLAAHGATRDMGVSVFEAFWPIHLALRDLETEGNIEPDVRLRDHRLPYALSIGTISAGDWAGSVPDRLVAEGRYGVALGETSAAARKMFQDRVAEACAGDSWLAEHPATVSWPGGQFGSGSMPPGHPLLGWVQGAVTGIRGSSPPERAVAYGSHLRLYAADGVPTVHFGPGHGRFAHAANEQVQLSDLIATARVVALLVLRTCGVR